MKIGNVSRFDEVQAREEEATRTVGRVYLLVRFIALVVTIAASVTLFGMIVHGAYNWTPN